MIPISLFHIWFLGPYFDFHIFFPYFIFSIDSDFVFSIDSDFIFSIGSDFVFHILFSVLIQILFSVLVQILFSKFELFFKTVLGPLTIILLEYVVIRVKNEKKESVCFGGLKCFDRFWRDFKAKQKS